MGRLSEYDQDYINHFKGLRLKLHSDTLSRVDGDLSNWTTEIKLAKGSTTPPIFASDMNHSGVKNRDASRGGVRILPHKNGE